MREYTELHVEDCVAELVLNRPETRNAMTAAMGREIRAAVDEINARDDIRVVIVRGAGKAFSSGGDFDMLDQRRADGADANRRAMRAFYALYLSVRDLHVPSIAAINGHAIGAGACFAVACDLRYASVGAKIGFTFVKLGLHPGMGATHLLPRLVGPAVAADLLLSGTIVDAAEAERIGLVNAVGDDAVVLARDKAQVIAACAPIAVAQAKASLRGALDRTFEDSLEGEARCQAVDYTTEDLAEGIAAVRAKRAPAFRGR